MQHVVRKLKERSINSLLHTRAGITPVNDSYPTFAEDELATFAGHSALLSHKSDSTTSRYQTPGVVNNVMPQWPTTSTTVPADTSSAPSLSMFTNPIPSDFQISEFDSVLSSLVSTDDQAQYDLNTASFVVQEPSTGDLPDFAMGDVGSMGQNDQWMQMLREFGMA